MKGLACVTGGVCNWCVLVASLLEDGLRSSTEGCVVRMLMVRCVDDPSSGESVEVAVIAPVEKFMAGERAAEADPVAMELGAMELGAMELSSSTQLIDVAGSVSWSPSRFDWLNDAHRLHVFHKKSPTVTGRVERLMGHSLQQYLEWEDPDLSDLICKEAFGMALQELATHLFAQREEEEAQTDPWQVPETVSARRLTAAERLHLFNLPADWRAVLNNEPLHVKLETSQPNSGCSFGGRWSRKTKLAVGLTTAAGLTTGAVLGAFFLGLFDGVDPYADDPLAPAALATLRAPAEACAKAWNTTAATALPASLDAWSNAPWCDGFSGIVVCSDSNTPNAVTEKTTPSSWAPHPSCYYFRSPFKYDLPTVWEAVVRHNAPKRCGVACDPRSVGLQRTARKLADTLHVYLDGVEPEDVASEVHKNVELNEACSHTRLPALHDPNCTSCSFAILNCLVQGQTGDEFVWGDVLDFDSNEHSLAQHVSAFDRPDYNVTTCNFRCYISKVIPRPTLTLSLTST
ncbi:putative transmembrane protein [Gregarina niphandrodes]|uniref:Transmembrane protein n=1 Tax=Gregarina niphandrodes TaxID=110365 RepID=A0A023B0M1_GRENI|nr:putative transmembrane protein [Gregarina niphandrodes]EZG44624.1 putative transmembrane protein [Gregarina niphandrodes]|eukprot:XP_011134143.1 putative transmembrane protein [Gregarina niphandrodes]